MGRDWVRTTFWDRNVDPGSTKYVVLLGKIKKVVLVEQTNPKI